MSASLKLAAIALVVACLLAACDSSTPIPPSSPAASPAAQIDASAPANSVQAPPSSGDPAPSASAALQPTPTPDPEAVRKAAAVGYLAAAGRATDALRAAVPKVINPPTSRAGAKAEGRHIAEAYGLFVAAMKQLEVPADTEADLRALIRRATVMQEFSLTQPPADGDAWWSYRGELNNKLGKLYAPAERVRAHLGLPGLCYDPSVCQDADRPPF